MAIQVGIPQAAMNSLIDLVDNVAEVKPGWEVVIVAHKDGLYGGPNLVDEEAGETKESAGTEADTEETEETAESSLAGLRAKVYWFSSRERLKEGFFLDGDNIVYADGK